jgi:hypothetical protein
MIESTPGQTHHRAHVTSGGSTPVTSGGYDTARARAARRSPALVTSDPVRFGDVDHQKPGVRQGALRYAFFARLM